MDFGFQHEISRFSGGVAAVGAGGGGGGGGGFSETIWS